MYKLESEVLADSELFLRKFEMVNGNYTDSVRAYIRKHSPELGKEETERCLANLDPRIIIDGPTALEIKHGFDEHLQNMRRVRRMFGQTKQSGGERE